MRSRVGRYLVCLLPCLILAGCGGSSPTSPSVTPTPVPTPTPALVTEVLLEGSQSDMGVLVLFSLGQFTTSSTGRLDVTVDWASAANNLDVYVTRGTCTLEQVNGGTCSFAARSESLTAKPEKVTVTSLPAGTYDLMIGNRGPNVDTATYKVTLAR